jgi:hypothetical protein
MIVAAPDDEAVLVPDDLRPDGEAGALQALGYPVRMDTSMPHIGDLARE